jgi:hypothetical protein
MPHKPFEERCPRMLSPVAEANSSVFLLFAGYYIRCRARNERFKNPACHTCSRRFFFYTTRSARAQGEVDEVGAKQAAVLQESLWTRYYEIRTD